MLVTYLGQDVEWNVRGESHEKCRSCHSQDHTELHFLEDKVYKCDIGALVSLQTVAVGSWSVLTTSFVQLTLQHQLLLRLEKRGTLWSNLSGYCGGHFTL